ncbi:MAG: NAD-dependent epimerase/dehydratase family protein [Candidatus Cloacimonetes bacterium]|nr:NAD-dependent epimerase/dehydratase family protein [Candidatus Cloacimonadota bacterium]
MSVVLITGSCGLIGSEAVQFFIGKGYLVVGIDNDMRSRFFGKEASTEANRKRLQNEFSSYVHCNEDIRDEIQMDRIFCEYGRDIKLVLHTAAQPSHDWAARDPLTDFGINATATMVLLEKTRKYAPEAVFIFTSTNKVYGDKPNELPLIEMDTRYELPMDHIFSARGIDESMSLDQSTHSLFGVSKAAADLMVQEYGRYFGMKTGVFRGGCLTGPGHAGAELHGFLSYLMRCTLLKKPYKVFGYGGKQVRDNIHSLDLVEAFFEFMKNPRCGEVYNIGGSRQINCSMLEAISLCEELCDSRLNWDYQEANRVGDHIWYISDTSKFEGHFPSWKRQYALRDILIQIRDEMLKRTKSGDV